MASIKKILNKDHISYQICVTHGKDISGKQMRYYRTYPPPATWGEKKAYTEATRQAASFEEEVKRGFRLDNRQTFAQYAEYILNLKRRNGVRESTLERYAELLRRINPSIGYFKLSEILPNTLNNLYTDLLKDGKRMNGVRATAKSDFLEELKRRQITRAHLATVAGVSPNTITQACKGLPIMEGKAALIAEAMGEKMAKLFKVSQDMTPLSDKTVLEHHRLISTILSQAEREMLVPYNAAAKATPPRPKKREPNYFQPETVYAILDAADNEPIKYKTFINMLCVTGCRRGELAGLKWSKINLETGQITIDCALLYTVKRGVYEGETKTGERRSIKIPVETIDLLKQLRRKQLELRFKMGDRWKDTGYVFTQDDGRPVNPQTWTSWIDEFSARHHLPHINPHAFRHTAASVLISNGTDVATVSKLLGHSSVSTTENFYTHLIEDAKAAASDTLTDVLLRRKA